MTPDNFLLLIICNPSKNKLFFHLRQEQETHLSYRIFSLKFSPTCGGKTKLSSRVLPPPALVNVKDIFCFSLCAKVITATISDDLMSFK